MKWLPLLLVAGCAAPQSWAREPEPGVDRVASFGPWMQRSPRSDVDLRARGPVSATLVLGLSAYQNTLSRADGHTCRFRPTCSGFAVEATSTHGPIGLAMAFGRLSRDHTDTTFYPQSTHGEAQDPLDAWTFFSRPEFEAMRDDPRFGWYRHVLAVEEAK